MVKASFARCMSFIALGARKHYIEQDTSVFKECYTHLDDVSGQQSPNQVKEAKSIIDQALVFLVSSTRPSDFSIPIIEALIGRPLVDSYRIYCITRILGITHHVKSYT